MSTKGTPSSSPSSSRSETRSRGQARGRVVTARAAVLALLAGILLASLPVLPAGATTRDSVAAGIDRFMRSQIKDSDIPGAAVAVVRGDRVLMVHGYGHDSTGKQMTGDSLFRIASLSKSFTALAVMQLVEAGKLHLDDPVQAHLPEFQLADPRASQITVRQLLNHTSGLTDAMVPELSRTPPHTLREATTSLRSAHLATTPGTRWSYHNPNYQVAARLVEVVSREPFNTYLRRHIFAPAGMTSSTSATMDDSPVPGLTQGHLTAYGHAFTASALGTFEEGDGGIVSTASDMARWLIINTNAGRTAEGTRVLSAAGTQTLHTPSAPQVGYALGWSTRGPAGHVTRIDHSGSLFSFTADEAIWPDTHYGVVMLFNAGSPMLFDQIAISHGVFDIVEGRTPPTSGPHSATRIDYALGVLTLVALFLGTAGVLRAGRWARRRQGMPVRRALSLVPAVFVLGVTVGFPRLAQILLGRDVTWKAGLYTWPALVVLLLTALLAAIATLLARAWHWTRTQHAS